MRLFVVHAPEDEAFVAGFLLPAMGLAEEEVLVSTRLEPGAPVVEEIARGALSPVTVVVMSPSFLASPWAQLASQLAMHQDVEAAEDGSATLVPAIVAECEVPLLTRYKVALDFRQGERKHWEAEVGKLRKMLQAGVPAEKRVPCPYPGMRSFEAKEAEHFHGREKEVEEALGLLRDGVRELYAIGPSGCGKSSLVAAGLVPKLRSSPELAGGQYVVRTMRPGAEPLAALARALEVKEAAEDEQGEGGEMGARRSRPIGRGLPPQRSNRRLTRLTTSPAVSTARQPLTLGMRLHQAPRLPPHSSNHPRRLATP